MSNVVLNETDKLKIKCAHLELTLVQERAQQQVRTAMLTRDELIKEAFLKEVPEGDINNYQFDLEGGLFTLNPSSEPVNAELVD